MTAAARIERGSSLRAQPIRAASRKAAARCARRERRRRTPGAWKAALTSSPLLSVDAGARRGSRAGALLLIVRGERLACGRETLAAQAIGKAEGGDPLAAGGDFRWPPMGRFPSPPSVTLADQETHLGRLSSWCAIVDWFAALVDIQIARQATGGCPISSLVSELAEVPRARGRRSRSPSTARRPGRVVCNSQTLACRRRPRAPVTAAIEISLYAA
jgi:hypothetical protein